MKYVLIDEEINGDIWENVLDAKTDAEAKSEGRLEWARLSDFDKKSSYLYILKLPDASYYYAKENGIPIGEYGCEIWNSLREKQRKTRL